MTVTKGMISLKGMGELATIFYFQQQMERSTHNFVAVFKKVSPVFRCQWVFLILVERIRTTNQDPHVV